MCMDETRCFYYEHIDILWSAHYIVYLPPANYLQLSRIFNFITNRTRVLIKSWNIFPFLLQTCKAFQGLDEERLYMLLFAANKEEMSLNTASQKANELKKMDAVTSTFMHLTGMSTWVEAQQNYPHHTDEKQLKPFLPMFPSGMYQLTKIIFQLTQLYCSSHTSYSSR